MKSGVSAEFFCKAIQALSKQHGSKQLAVGMEDVRKALEAAERAYRELPEVVKKPRKKWVR